MLLIKICLINLILQFYLYQIQFFIIVNGSIIFYNQKHLHLIDLMFF